MNINERIAALRSLMKEKNIDAYMIPSADNHQSEYVGDYFKSRAFISGFTGSAGTVVVTMNESGLWADGRYFIQAEAQLSGSEMKLFKMGEPGVPTIEEYLETVLPENGVLGFDGRVISQSQGKLFKAKYANKNVRLEDKFDLINEIWSDRPAMSDAPIFLLEEKYSGESTSSKLARLRAEMKSLGATSHIIITLDDIAWLLNFRGHDVAYTMVALCYAVIDMEAVHLFMDEVKVSDEIKSEFAKDNIILHPYNDVYEYVRNLSDSEVVLIDPARLNYALYNSIPSGAKTIEKMNPCIPFKAIKNDTELENIRIAPCINEFINLLLRITFSLSLKSFKSSKSKVLSFEVGGVKLNCFDGDNLSVNLILRLIVSFGILNVSETIFSHNFSICSLIGFSFSLH